MSTNREAPNTAAVVEAVDLRCSYGSFEAVRGVSLKVRPGEVFALLGTNGAGKTTTLETLEGHRAPNEGTVRVFALDPLQERAETRRRTGIMLQESGFAGELTVAETLRLSARLTARKADPTAATARLQLAHRRDVRVSQLSGGERRRLDLAIAALGDPELLFLDEPTTGLDPESRQQVWNLVRELSASGSTIMLTTHYLEEAEALADRLAIMHDGRLAVEGTVDELLAARSARIAFDLPDQLTGADLPWVSGEVDQDLLRLGRFECRTRQLQEDLARILDWAGSRQLRLGRMEAKHASLADLFLEVSGGGVGDLDHHVDRETV